MKLTLESDMADEVLRELLPRFDRFYGGIRGVPGLREFSALTCAPVAAFCVRCAPCLRPTWMSLFGPRLSLSGRNKIFLF
ncbi:hypothetical protein ABZ611_19800 [Streptomyces sp. NPDC007861]|uniref:hypothetical protein n=1 Tax=Streptomyces sp. NPDC007861 TaxID=3154893 RepID=UPI0033F010CD